MTEQYVIIPGTQQRVYEGSVVMLHRLPNLKWIIHNGYYNYNGRRQKGWYFSSIPADTTMPVFNEDLVAMTVLDGSGDPGPYPPAPPVPPGPCPPGPFPPGPCPPIPVPFTPKDKEHLDAAMLTVENLRDRDRLGSSYLQDGKIVRVNDTDGHGTVEYYAWNAAKSEWEEASLGYRYMTREEVTTAMASSIVSILWSDEDGALVLTNHGGEGAEVPLTGVVHDPSYTQEELTLRFPIYGFEDLVITIPKDRYIRSLRFEPQYTFPDGHVGPAIVVVVSDGETEEEIAGDASGMVNIYTGAETATATIIISSESGEVTADVKLSSLVDNPLKVDNEGLYVDLSGVVKKQEIDEGYLLVADGQGGFTYGGTGIELETTTAIADLTNPEKKVVTANLIADAIHAAIIALQTALENRLDFLEGRMDGLEGDMAILEGQMADLEDKFDIGEGEPGGVIIATENGIERSNIKIGSGTLSPYDEDLIAREEAVKAATSWISFE